MIQKRIIAACNRRGLPVITATQMLESMTSQPRPTRAEASDVANAILDGTDAVMLSGESAVGQFPVQAVEMLARIAAEVEPQAAPLDYLPDGDDDVHAIAQAIRAIDGALPLRCIAAFTHSGYTARLVAAERPRAPIVALTPDARVYRAMNLLRGVRPICTGQAAATADELVQMTETLLRRHGLAAAGDKLLIVAGVPLGTGSRTNLVKLHVLP
jgi:pyruvate kinase